MSDGRTTILARVREALSIPTDTKFLHFRQHDGAAPADPRSFMPPCGDNAKDRIELFRLNSEQLRTEFHVCPDLEMAAVLVRGLAAKEGWKKVGAHRHPMVDALVAGAGVPVLLTDDGYATPDLESCSVGITACEALIAQTGSVLVTSRSSGGRALSVLPEHHIVISSADQLIGGLSDAYDLLHNRYGENWPSFMSFITGPSRTGDIERILVLGAHGPKRLTVLMIV